MPAIENDPLNFFISGANIHSSCTQKRKLSTLSHFFCLHQSVQVVPGEKVTGESQNIFRFLLQHLMHKYTNHSTKFRMSLQVSLVLHVNLYFRSVEPLLLLSSELCGFLFVHADLNFAQVK
uniref:Uncharacterized protein n=1 Tax=Noctiluca scintillans TaxID=2966 RepID=A0A7S1F939_NOCSC